MHTTEVFTVQESLNRFQAVKAKRKNELTGKSKHDYWKEIGNHIYPMMHTWPDIALATGKFSQFMANPQPDNSLLIKLKDIRSMRRWICEFGMANALLLISLEWTFSGCLFDERRAINDG